MVNRKGFIEEVNQMLKELANNKCLRCDYEWVGLKQAKQCPKCKRYDWNEKKEVK